MLLSPEIDEATSFEKKMRRLKNFFIGRNIEFVAYAVATFTLQLPIRICNP
jgi:hypothetical protein